MTLPRDLVLVVAAILERLGIPYQLGGSFASSAHGLYRASADADFVIDPTDEKLLSLGAALEPEFYVSPGAMREALESLSTFNAIHVATSFKLDFFVKGSTPFDAEELRRSVRLDLGEGRSVLVKSAEDTVLRKLDWYRRGHGVSERQWKDVLSVLAANRGRLDEDHLDRWARELGIDDLLARARNEAEDL